MCLQKLPTAAHDGLLRPEELVGQLAIREATAEVVSRLAVGIASVGIENSTHKTVAGKVLSDDEQLRLTAIASCIHAKQDLRNMSFMNEDGFVVLVYYLRFDNG